MPVGSRVRARRAGRIRTGSDLGTVGTPGAMVLLTSPHGSGSKEDTGSKVQQPTLIIHSRQDDYADLNNAAAPDSCAAN